MAELVFPLFGAGEAWDARRVAYSDSERLVRDSIALGMPADRIAARLRSEGVKPMDAIKALRSGAGVSLGEAKLLVDRTLPAEWQAMNDQLRDAAEQSLAVCVDPGTQQRIVEAISHDLVVTSTRSPTDAAILVQRVAYEKSQIEFWAERDVDDFAMFVAEEVQQQLHDTFEDTSWPSCPEHKSHPLWLRREQGEGPAIWVCSSTGRSYGQLGKLLG